MRFFWGFQQYSKLMLGFCQRTRPDFLPYQPSLAYDMKMRICKTLFMCHQMYFSGCVGAKCTILFTAGVSYWFRVSVSVTECTSSVVGRFQGRILSVSRQVGLSWTGTPVIFFFLLSIFCLVLSLACFWFCHTKWKNGVLSSRIVFLNPFPFQH